MMSPDDKKRLAQLLAERVRDRDAEGDAVGMFTTARLLDQVEGELERPPAPPETDKPSGRRVFVRG